VTPGAGSPPPFLTDRRIVVVRDAGRLTPSDAARLVECLGDPLPGVTLVLVAGGGTVPAPLVKAIERGGGIVDTAVGTGRARTEWLRERLQRAPVRVDARAAARLGEHLGEDMSRLRGLLDMLAAAYGEGASIDVELLEPFLGEAGMVAPWELTDAIDTGDTGAALDVLTRMFGSVRWHPLAVLALLHRHYQSMLRLEGPARVGRAITLLAEADLDVRGLSGLPDKSVLEVLVGRLSRLSVPRHPPGQPAPSRSGSSRRRS
jgi:DNA polymerase-3 subunit delta